MTINVKTVCPNKSFDISGMSYIGKPRSNTAMYITKKVSSLLPALIEVDNCLVFAENGLSVSAKLEEKHAFCFSDSPQKDYASFADSFYHERLELEKKIPMSLVDGRYYISETAEVGENAYIEPGCIIGPDVIIGKNAFIMAGTIIKHSIIGDNFVSNEYALIGSNGFTMTEDDCGNKFRIPTLGRVIIGNNVEVGAHDNISCGSGGDTIIDDYVKLDSLVHVGHDVHIHKNTEIASGTILGGFSSIGERVFMGINTTVRNRVSIEDGAFISMGAAVMKNVSQQLEMIGNPARPVPTVNR